MNAKDALRTAASHPRTSRVLLTLGLVALLTLAADPAAACDPPHDEPVCDACC
jgi:hypothetical protein